MLIFSTLFAYLMKSEKKEGEINDEKIEIRQDFGGCPNWIGLGT
jgi:hypothetical protein